MSKTERLINPGNEDVEWKKLRAQLNKKSEKLTRRSFIRQSSLWTAAAALGCNRGTPTEAIQYKAHLIPSAADASDELEKIKRSNASAVIIPLDETTNASGIESFKRAARALSLDPGFWVEVGRNEDLAQAHTEWLHVPQHTDWLVDFPEWKGEKAAVFPWICVNNKAVFDYQLQRIARLVAHLEPGDTIFLNDVQGPPAGCGCGNLQCRSWDNSPGEKVAPSPYEHKDVYFTALFIGALKRNHPALRIVPIICAECERGVTVGSVDSPDEKTGYCHAVNCSDPCARFYYPGLVRALANLERVGLLCTYKALRRDIPLYGERGAWVSANIRRYAESKRNLITVLQGWDVDEAEVQAQIKHAGSEAIFGYILSRLRLDQSFKPVSVFQSS